MGPVWGTELLVGDRVWALPSLSIPACKGCPPTNPGGQNTPAVKHSRLVEPRGAHCPVPHRHRDPRHPALGVQTLGAPRHAGHGGIKEPGLLRQDTASLSPDTAPLDSTRCRRTAHESGEPTSCKLQGALWALAVSASARLTGKATWAGVSCVPMVLIVDLAALASIELLTVSTYSWLNLTNHIFQGICTFLLSCQM